VFGIMAMVRRRRVRRRQEKGRGVRSEDGQPGVSLPPDISARAKLLLLLRPRRLTKRVQRWATVKHGMPGEVVGRWDPSP
jgi:hypothetical protein